MVGRVFALAALLTVQLNLAAATRVRQTLVEKSGGAVFSASGDASLSQAEIRETFKAALLTLYPEGRHNGKAKCNDKWDVTESWGNKGSKASSCKVKVPCGVNMPLRELAANHKLAMAPSSSYLQIIKDIDLDAFPGSVGDSGASKSGSDFYKYPKEDPIVFLKTEGKTIYSVLGEKADDYGSDYGPIHKAFKGTNKTMAAAFVDRVLQREAFQHSEPSLLQHYLMAFEAKCGWGLRARREYFLLFATADPMRTVPASFPVPEFVHKFDLKGSREIPDECHASGWRKDEGTDGKLFNKWKDGKLGDYLATYGDVVAQKLAETDTSKLDNGLQADMGLLAAWHLIDYSFFVEVRKSGSTLKAAVLPFNVVPITLDGQDYVASISVIDLLMPKSSTQISNAFFRSTLNKQYLGGRKYQAAPFFFYCLGDILFHGIPEVEGDSESNGTYEHLGVGVDSKTARAACHKAIGNDGMSRLQKCKGMR